jgi:hypothetical protein
VASPTPTTAFSFDRDLGGAELQPPTPFSGSATLRRNENEAMATLGGDLQLSFPGRVAIGFRRARSAR